MVRARRVLIVAAGLAFVGGITGAVCGVLALVPLLGVGDFGFAGLAAAAPWAAATGAAVGAVSGPLLAWSLLRHVPLWRVALWAASGTVVGSFYGLAAGSRLPLVFPALISGALFGMVAGGILLRRRVARESHADTLPALPNVR
jgi:uncharacterized membrane protein YfcA